MKNVLFLFLTIVLSFLFSNNLISQNKLLWDELYIGPDDTTAYIEDLFIDNNNNIYVTGGLYRISHENDIFLLKYSPQGQLLWEAFFDGDSSYVDYGYSIDVDDSGNVYVAGRSYFRGTDRDFTVLKYNSDGVLQWVINYNGPASARDAAYDLIIGNDGYIYVTGEIRSTMLEVATLKISPAGNIIWARHFDGINHIGAHGNFIETDFEGNIIVGGATTRDSEYYDYLILKYDTSGNLLWSTTFEDTLNLSSGWMWDMKVNSKGDIYTSGYNLRNGQSPRLLSVKFNISGGIEWYDINGYNVSEPSLCLDNNENLIVGASIFSQFFDYYSLKYSTVGNLQWSNMYHFSNNYDVFSDIASDEFGNIFVAGYCYTNTPSLFDGIISVYSLMGLTL